VRTINTRKYLLITGGELFNKGAQSMTFTAVDELKSRFPNKEVILLSNLDYRRQEEYKNKFSFKILPLNMGLMFELMGGIKKLVWELKTTELNKHEYKPLVPILINIMNNAEIMIDISGYALSSQRGIGTSVEYLLRIKLAKLYGIKVFLMPQSFGPFSYKGLTKHLFKYYIKKYMKYPKIIYARESEGYNILHDEYHLENVKRSNDLVLLNREINLLNIYKRVPEIANFKDIKDIKDIAIIPNMKNFKHGKIEQIMLFYDICINNLINSGKTVYLIRHSFEDLKACQKIKERFGENNNVVLLTDDFSCIEFDRLVKKFDFIIGSRYHSIIHAYKNGIPCIVMGWATKYHELLKTFKQEKYLFDVRTSIDIQTVEKAVKMMLVQHQKESENIITVLKEIQVKNVFDVM